MQSTKQEACELYSQSLTRRIMAAIRAGARGLVPGKRIPRGRSHPQPPARTCARSAVANLVESHAFAAADRGPPGGSSGACRWVSGALTRQQRPIMATAIAVGQSCAISRAAQIGLAGCDGSWESPFRASRSTYLLTESVGPVS